MNKIKSKIQDLDCKPTDVVLLFALLGLITGVYKVESFIAGAGWPELWKDPLIRAIIDTAGVGIGASVGMLTGGFVIALNELRKRLIKGR